MMTKAKISEIFTRSGISQEQMKRFHQAFEEFYPEDHQAFLAWLNIDEKEQQEIRKAARHK